MKAKKVLTKVDAVPLATGIQAILLDMSKKLAAEGSDESPRYPVAEFERLLMESKGISREQAEYVTERIICTGIIRWELGANCFVL